MGTPGGWPAYAGTGPLLSARIKRIRNSQVLPASANINQR